MLAFQVHLHQKQGEGTMSQRERVLIVVDTLGVLLLTSFWVSRPPPFFFLHSFMSESKGAGANICLSLIKVLVTK